MRETAVYSLGRTRPTPNANPTQTPHGTAITPMFERGGVEERRDARGWGVSRVTGPMIRERGQIARAGKALYPDLPVVLGGWHPSLLPDQTLAAECVDVVIRGQGEDAFLE